MLPHRRYTKQQNIQTIQKSNIIPTINQTKQKKPSIHKLAVKISKMQNNSKNTQKQ